MGYTGTLSLICYLRNNFCPILCLILKEFIIDKWYCTNWVLYYTHTHTLYFCFYDYNIEILDCYSFIYKMY